MNNKKLEKLERDYVAARKYFHTSVGELKYKFHNDIDDCLDRKISPSKLIESIMIYLHKKKLGGQHDRR